ncbi:hypothetical protein CCR97_09100 [Rhodoplanes elegans]|uniref:DUF262 domain-containing protein n=1 Tax=Rhodoplanes elegans TaxID=29408 RepID=A0A327KQW3_9BRAD|nr:DUF262 domain-containing protein [Rhodoplanes elegans]MBK5958366.1 hypothetical protein [Rhodoplanes elegans]RAI39742.1 hypothetical protein CH338_08440 [Rhodoplanes elegans]
MKPSIRTLGEILYSPSQYVIPVFQRNYRWETPQWQKLWESLIEIQAPEKQGNHFMGFLVFVPGVAQPGQHTTFHLIDGQQRLTSSSVVLTALRNIARDAEQIELADEIHQYYLVHPNKKGDQHYRLLPKERDHDSYLAIVNRTDGASGRIADALAFFEEQIWEYAADHPDRLRTLFNTVCQRMEFMCATLEAENAYNIFKSLNSTGVPLGPSDLIRNFVFMHVRPENHDDFDREHWSAIEDRFATKEGVLDEEAFSRFFRDYLMSDGRYVSPRETFATFESRYESTGFSPAVLAEELRRSVDDYSIIASQRPDPSADITSALAGLNVLDSSTTYPLLLFLFRLRRNGQIDATGLAVAVENLRGFILRRFICGESSRGYGHMFVRAIPKGETSPLAALERYLLDRGWPDDTRFENAFVEATLYGSPYAPVVLATLERSRGHREPAALDSTQVEHIMPQTLNPAWIEALGPDARAVHAKWLHRPGNLTLSAYNLELWNHPFSIKRERYAQSNIVITRELASFDRWTDAQIEERGRRLAKDAGRIWKGPAEPVASSEVTDRGLADREVLRVRFWNDLRERFVLEHPEIPTFEPKGNWTVRLQSVIRHIGVELRFSFRRRQAAIDVWFWRTPSMPVWELVRSDPAPWNDLIEATWEFEKLEGRDRARMFISRPVPEPRNEATWPEVFDWFSEKAVLLVTRVSPRLREEMDRISQS